MAGRELKVEVLLELSKKKVGKGQKKMQIVSYNGGAPKLVNQFYFWDSEKEEMRPGKIASIDAEDWKIIKKNNKKISELLKQK